MGTWGHRRRRQSRRGLEPGGGGGMSVAVRADLIGKVNSEQRLEGEEELADQVSEELSSKGTS